LTRFATDTAVTALGGGRYAATIDRGWWIERGPNGGYLAAIVLRAVLAEVADPERAPRSFTLHYLRPPVEGPCELEVTVERSGRGLSTVSARMVQDGRVCIVALVALGVQRPGPTLDEHPAPSVPDPEDVPPRPAALAPGQPDIPIRHRYDTRPAIGTPPFTRGDEALTGGWIRSADDEPLDVVLVAAITDAWFPAVFSRLELPIGVPTIDLTIHFRHLPEPTDRWALVRFRTTVATDGYLEEDGEVWSVDGRLLAQSRQLAVLLPPGPPTPGG
jgi:acyl-CoA thioesterase